MDELNIFAHLLPTRTVPQPLQFTLIFVVFFGPEYPNRINFFSALVEHCRCKLLAFDEFSFFFNLALSVSRMEKNMN